MGRCIAFKNAAQQVARDAPSILTIKMSEFPARAVSQPVTRCHFHGATPGQMTNLGFPDLQGKNLTAKTRLALPTSVPIGDWSSFGWK